VKLSESDLKLLRRLADLPEAERRSETSILIGYAQLKANGYARMSHVNGDILTEITSLGRLAITGSTAA
jgi:hypothetical protein